MFGYMHCIPNCGMQMRSLKYLKIVVTQNEVTKVSILFSMHSVRWIFLFIKMIMPIYKCDKSVPGLVVKMEILLNITTKKRVNYQNYPEIFTNYRLPPHILKITNYSMSRNKLLYSYCDVAAMKFNEINLISSNPI